SNAFISKFALAAEASQTTYPAPPSGGIATSMSVVSSNAYWDQSGLCRYFLVDVGLDLTSAISGPPPTGSISFSSGSWNGDSLSAVSGSWGGSTLLTLMAASSEGGLPEV